MKTNIQILTFVLVATVSLVSKGSEPKTYEGFLVIAPEVEVFQPCGSKAELWLDYDQKTREPMAKKYRELAKKPYEATFAVLSGYPGPKLDCGFCENFEGSFKVLKVIEQRRVRSADCR